MTIEITLNSAPTVIQEGATLLELISAHLCRELDAAGQAVDGTKLGIAAAVNGAVVPRSAWSQSELAAGHTVELVTAAQGG